MLTDTQVRVLRRKLMEGKRQEGAAAAAGMSVRSARHWQSGPYPSKAHKPHGWRTRRDPFAEVFEREIVPLLVLDDRRLLEARTLLGELERRHPGGFSTRHLRTLQRRLREWRALHGPEQEVYFPQEHPPGREAAFDFTSCNDLAVTIGGEPFPHLLFELTLSYSGWRWQMVAASESFEATAAGVQGALWDLGGVSEVLRSDNLSAATHDLRRSRGRTLNRRYRDLLEHYGLRSSLIQVGEAHENGVVEQAHRRTKSMLAQALLLRGSCNFSSAEEYQQWLRTVVEREHNSQLGERLAEERRHLRPLPAAPIPAYTRLSARVRRWSTITVQGHIYSLPSRLIGERVMVRVYAEQLEVYYRDQLIERLPRLRHKGEVHIDYRHIIRTLVRKPGAFARYRWREELFPGVVFRRAYDALRSRLGERASAEYVRILSLAANHGAATVEQVLGPLLDGGERFDAEQLQSLIEPARPELPVVTIPRPDLRLYDALLSEEVAS
jgi:Mu transposase, C-terminal domain